jgi:hypothetical protein
LDKIELMHPKTILGLNSSYNKGSPVTSIGLGILISATWGMNQTSLVHAKPLLVMLNHGFSQLIFRIKGWQLWCKQRANPGLALDQSRCRPNKNGRVHST